MLVIIDLLNFYFSGCRCTNVTFVTCVTNVTFEWETSSFVHGKQWTSEEVFPRNNLLFDLLSKSVKSFYKKIVHVEPWSTVIVT